ncbi:Eco57I restriction-modification methylase domain-containing protein [Halomicrococcus gelatinilyticus]|uniref:Eco57I restriction-modification methylase domain-containing protein n=1 Tax=Halomicrococcus gelatinilyticus TaxID=1702103 RepID=UPI002E139F95
MDAFEGTLFSDRLLADVAALADDDLPATREQVSDRYEQSRRDGTNRAQVVESVLSALGGRPSTVAVVGGPPDGHAAVEAHAESDRGDGDDPRAAVTDGRRWRLLLADEPPDRHLDVDLPATLDAPERFAIFAVTFGPREAFERLLDAREAHVTTARTDLRQSLQEGVRRAAGRLLGVTADADDAGDVEADGATEDPNAALDAACVLAFRIAAVRFAAVRGRDADAEAPGRAEDDLPFGRAPELATERRLLDGLTRDDVAAVAAALDGVDYAALDARHLGDAYERLLDATVEVDDGAVSLSSDDGARGATGAYYTPEYLVDHAVETAVDGPDATVLDPAMGCGHFLVRALDRLTVERAREGESLDDARRAAVRQLHGVDVDPAAVELARTAVWLRSGHWPDERLRTGDALADGDVRNALDDLDRVDAVVANPPYVRNRAIPDGRKADLRERFETATGSFDLYVPFVERMCELGERVCAVVPNKWTTARYGERLRRRLLDRHRLREILDASNVPAFADADVYPVVVSVAADEGPTDSVRVRTAQSADEVETADGDDAGAAISRSFVDALGDDVIPVGVDPAFAPLAERVRQECDGLGDHVTLTEGVHTGNVRDELVVERAGTDCERVVGGRDVERYGVEWDGDWLRYDESVVAADGAYGDLRDPTVFEEVKLLVRDISDRPVAAFDEDGLYALNTLYSARRRAESPLPLRYVLAVLNSTFAAVYFRQVYGGTHVSGGYLRCKPMFLANLPLPRAPDERDRLADLAARMGTLRRERSARSLDPPTASGPRLADLDPDRVGAGSFLDATARSVEGLRLGRVTVDEAGADSPTVVAATARYRPDGRDRGLADGETADRETDEWGFVETDPLPALAFDVDGARRDLLGAFVPRAVERGDVRKQAGRTISLLDRLERVRLPALDDARPFLEEWRHARELDDALAETDAAIDRRVYRAYGLDDDEIALVERLANGTAESGTGRTDDSW